MNKYVKYITFAACLAVGSGGVWYYIHQSTQSVQLVEFEYNRDSDFIKKLFQDNWYWLVASDTYDVDYMLFNKASSKRSEDFGNLTIKTLYDNDEPLGFIAYYKKSFYVGFILFVSVGAEYRSRGYAKYMMQQALNDLRCQNVLRVRLVTRVENYAAQKVYTSLGFNEESRDDTFVHYQLRFD
jgi:ribosomal protein S18 acetylase RimI-like enzyme